MKRSSADISVAYMMVIMQNYSGQDPTKVTKHFPLLSELAKAVESEPTIAAYIASRPVTERW